MLIDNAFSVCRRNHSWFLFSETRSLRKISTPKDAKVNQSAFTTRLNQSNSFLFFILSYFTLSRRIENWNRTSEKSYVCTTRLNSNVCTKSFEDKKSLRLLVYKKKKENRACKIRTYVFSSTIWNRWNTVVWTIKQILLSEKK